MKGTGPHRADLTERVALGSLLPVVSQYLKKKVGTG